MTQPSKRVVLGTAGHIDHGKTALVKALTGIDTDRLKEEKERGITIELGFATLDLDGGRRLAIVDVPGHERFVRTMVAGATGIDTVLFIVAADEGVMPQTREHLEICSLLGIQGGVVALTKADLVEPDFLELACEDVANLMRGTFLEGAPVVAVSAVTGQGLDELKRELAALVDRVEPRDPKGLFRLPVDRVFTIKGFGTVVTGTLVSGSVRREDEVEILPSGVRAKVRGIEVHGEEVERAWAGNRAALNFSGIGVEEIERGQTVVHPGTLKPTRMADVRLKLSGSAGKPLSDRAQLRLHLGTQEVPVTVALLEGEQLSPGGETYAQLRSREQFVPCPGDRFVLRSYSPARTVGGGRVLDHGPHRHKGRRPEVAEDLAALDASDPAERLAVFLRLRREEGMTPSEAQAALAVTLEQARNLFQALVRTGRALVADRKTQRHVDVGYMEELETRALDLLARFHAENPLKRGLGVEELRTKFPDFVSPRLVAFALERLQEKGQAAVEGDLVRRGDFAVRLSHEDEALRARILHAVRARGFEGPTAEEAAELLGEPAAALRPVLDYLASGGVLSRTKEGFYFDAALIDSLVGRVIAKLAEAGQITVADIKAFTNASRKYTIPLMEHLDGRKITQRRGEVRVAGAKGRTA